MAKSPAWQRKEGKSKSGGLNAKGRASAKAQGMNLKPNVPEPTTEELKAEIPQYQRQFDVETFKKDIDTKVSALLNSTAQSRGYSDSQSIASYVNSSNTQWQAESQAFIAWRDQVWEHVYFEYLAIHAGGSIPNEDEYIASLPQIVWPS